MMLPSGTVVFAFRFYHYRWFSLLQLALPFPLSFAIVLPVLVAVV
jgi:hypothetical protein